MDGTNVFQLLRKISMVRNSEGGDERGWKALRRWFDM
jgi:hypothetical protein